MLNISVLSDVGSKIDFREKRIGVYKVLAPFFYEDGDMYDIFVEESPENNSKLRLSDYGLTLMKLSYAFDLNTDHKKEVLESILTQNRINYSNGDLYLDIYPAQFTVALYQLAQVISKVSNLEIISRESLKSYFNEYLSEFIIREMKEFEAVPNFLPTKNRELLVDYKIPAAKPIYIFGVDGNSKASKVVISCLTFITKNIPYRSLIVHENFENLSNFNKNQITNTVDKQFTSLDDFRNQGIDYVRRELSA